MTDIVFPAKLADLVPQTDGNVTLRYDIQKNANCRGGEQVEFTVPAAKAAGLTRGEEVFLRAYDGGIIWEFDASTLSLAPTRGTGTPTLTRAANTATRVNPSGLIEIVNADLPRFDYNPITLALRGLLIEESRTNLALRSAEFDNAAWSKIDVTVSANNAVSPDGGVNADVVVEGVAGNCNLTQAYTGTSNASQAVSIFIKPRSSSPTWMRLVINETGTPGNRVTVWFNILAGTVGSAVNGGTGTGAAGYIERYGDGWLRLTITGAPNNAATAMSFFFQSADDDASTLRNLNGVSYTIWGAQIENSATGSTSYIPTTSASVTRAADVITLATASIPGFSETTLTMYAEAYGVTNPTAASELHVLTIDDGTNNERFTIRKTITSAGAAFVVVDGGAATALTGTGTWSATSITKVAGAAAVNSVQMAANGVLGTEDTSATLPTVTTVNIGCRAAGASGVWNAAIRKLRLYNRRLDNAELIGISTP